jgi:N-acetylglucosaminyl-diphospho-decaprenol L-rhamnosyltransferase
LSQVAVIVLSWNTRALLAECLEAVYSSHTPPGFFEVWVVDNASSDGSVELVQRRFPQAHLIANANNLGFAQANNQALAQVATPYALLLNSDAILPPAALGELTECLEQRPQAGAAGPLYVRGDGSFQASFADFPSLGTEMLEVAGLASRLVRPTFPSHGPAESQATRVVDWIPGACLLVRMDAVKQIGLLDEGFFFYSEEVDWCYRLAKSGWQVWYWPAVVVTHYVGQSARGASEASLRHLYLGKMRFFAKHYGPMQASVLKIWAVLTLGLLAGLALGQSLWRGGPGASWQMYLSLAAKLLREPSVRPA